MSESKLVYEVMQELGKHGAVFRCNSGSVTLASGKRFRGMPKGFSDILMIMPGGKVAFIECKTMTGKLSAEQERFIEKMQGLGCVAGTVRSVDEAKALCGISS
jgi:hypothetical protein